ncbi:MAG: ferredoxin [Nanoarchaeota archaeon]
MAKYRIEFDREACIGALVCNAIAPEYWLLSDDGKVDLKGATFNKETKKWELIIDEEEFKLNDDAAYSCPVTVIKLIKLAEEKPKVKEKAKEEKPGKASDS